MSRLTQLARRLRIDSTKSETTKTIFWGIRSKIVWTIAAGDFFYGRKEVDMPKQTKLKTTVGDLIVALTDETQRQFHDDRITYEVVAFMLADLLKRPVTAARRRL